MQSKTRIFATAFLVFSLSLFLFLFISPREVDATAQDHKIDICHSTASHSNPYTTNNVDKNSTVQGHNLHTGPIWFKGITVNWGDIIPPFEYEDSCPPNGSDAYDSDNCGKEGYTCEQGNKCASPTPGGSYAGMNWTDEGEAIWENGCKVVDDGDDEVKESHILKLTSMCTDLKTKENIWRVFHKDTSDYFYPVLLGYEIYSGPITTIDKFFTYNHTEATRFTDPYFFRTDVTGDSQTVKLYWWNYDTEKWVYSDTKASKNEPCEPLYEQCSVTTEEPGEWSAWVIDSEDNSRFVSERIISYFDSQEKEYLCDSTTEKKYLGRDICEWDEELYADDPLCVEPNGNGDPEDDDEGDVLGESTEVKGTTTVVLASTAGGDRSTIFLIQSLLLIATGFSLIYVGKEYLNRYEI